MSSLPALPWDAVSQHDRKITTTSLKVAAVFGKRHDHVLRDINQLLSRPKSGEPNDPVAEFSRSNFGPRDYIDERGKTQPMVEMTKNGFALLVMGYTGEKAMLFKIAYIAQFDAMAERLDRGDALRASTAERAFFARYPESRVIRAMALQGEPYWFIGRAVGRSAGTVSNAIRRMIAWGLMTRQALSIARTGMTVWWRHRRKFANQLNFGF